MRFLADESCDFAAVRVLRDAGHEVVAVCEMRPGMSDAEVARLAASEKRILLTEDRHFGEFVYAHGVEMAGVIFIRFPATARPQLQRSVLGLIETHGAKLESAFVVVEPGRFRFAGARPQQGGD